VLSGRLIKPYIRQQKNYMKILILLCTILATLGGFAQETAPVRFVNPSSVATPHGYSQAAVIDLGRCTMVVLSGQVALDPKGNLVGKDDVEKQADQVFQNIRSSIVELGGSMKDIVKLGYFVTDVSKIQAIRTVRDRYINTQTPPASTLVQVSRLFREDILIEIEATAVIPRK
jgi:enamine deaminase RidA (YjgF/YER057c/UK114 family)